MKINLSKFWSVFEKSTDRIAQLLDAQGKPVEVEGLKKMLEEKMKEYEEYEALLEDLTQDVENFYMALAVLILLEEVVDEPMKFYELTEINNEESKLVLLHGNVVITQSNLIHNGIILITGNLKVQGLIQNQDEYCFLAVGGNITSHHIWESAGSWITCGGNIENQGLVWVDDESTIVACLGISSKLAIEGTLGTGTIYSAQKEFENYFEAEDMSNDMEDCIENLKDLLNPEVFEGEEDFDFQYILQERLMAGEDIWRD